MKIEKGDKVTAVVKDGITETFVVSDVSENEVTLQSYDLNDLFSFVVPRDRLELSLM
jgi:hypothetical protein